MESYNLTLWERVQVLFLVLFFGSLICLVMLVFADAFSKSYQIQEVDGGVYTTRYCLPGWLKEEDYQMQVAYSKSSMKVMWSYEKDGHTYLLRESFECGSFVVNGTQEQELR